MTMTIQSLAPSTLAVTVEGKLEKADYSKFVPLAEQRIAEHGTINLLIEIRDFKGWTPAAFWQDLKFDVSHYRDVSRLAIVGEDSKRWMATLSKPFTAADVKFFPAAEIDAARQWVLGGATSSDTSDTPLDTSAAPA